ncbi:MAG: hypothetical protein H0V65_08095, partial [Chitinophagales bacterium]|nr:hypothetical protein [Chitinophagales bacterium]
MTIAIKIINRIISVTFYQRHAGLFLFIFIIMFGVVQGQQLLSYHLTLINAMLSSMLFMSVVCLIWTLYALKCIQFVLKTFSEPQHQFLYVFAALTRAQQFNTLFAAQLTIYLPVLIYSIIVVLVAFAGGNIYAGMFVLSYNLLLCLLSTSLYQRKLNNPDPEVRFFLDRFFQFQFKRPYALFFIAQLLNEMKVIFVVTKFFSAIIIIAFLKGFFIDTYDSRVVMLGFLAGLVAHCVLVFEFRKFEESYLSFYRNLPLSLFKRYLTYLTVYALILVPEWIIFIAGIPETVYPLDATWLPCFGIGFLLFLHCLLYKRGMDMDRYMPWVFAVTAVLFFLILYKAYLIISALLLLLSYFFMIQ